VRVLQAPGLCHAWGGHVISLWDTTVGGFTSTNRRAGGRDAAPEKVARSCTRTQRQQLFFARRCPRSRQRHDNDDDNDDDNDNAA
jgi:hypothetical protein